MGVKNEPEVSVCTPGWVVMFGKRDKVLQKENLHACETSSGIQVEVSMKQPGNLFLSSKEKYMAEIKFGVS